MKTSGIYKIVNKVNGKYYVGSSLDIFGEPHGRFYQHKAHLKCQRHYNKHLQRAWNKYGPDAFEFIVVETTDPSKNEVLTTEQKYLDTARMEKHKCYNKSFTASGPDWSEENRKKRSILISGKNNPNYGNGAKIRGQNNPFYGRKHSAESISKIIVGRLKRRGKNNVNYDHAIYKFYNIDAKISFAGTRSEFMEKYKEMKCSSVSELVNKKIKQYKKWILITS
jgi:group I intron endonuclease